MESIMQQTIAVADLGKWVCIAVIVLFFLNKTWETFFPKIKKKILRDVEIDQNDKDLFKELGEIRREFKSEIDDIKKQISRIDEKLDNDNNRIHRVEKKTETLESLTMDSLEERSILIKSTLAILKGLQEIGANGPTKEAQAEIERYLTQKSHEV